MRIAKLEDVQDRLWKMYVTVSELFDKEGIRYFLSWGSLLGALRHGDFIPWDDDLDLSVDARDYDRAEDVLRRALPDGMIFQDAESEPGYWLPYGKVRDLRSEVDNTLYAQYNQWKYRGVALDLFRYCAAWLSPVDATLSEAQDYLRAAWRKRKPLAIAWHAARAGGLAPVRACLKRKMTRMDPFGNNTPFPWKWIYPLRKVAVRGRLCPIPNQAEKLLEHLYGDWRTPPPADKRRIHFGTVKFLDEA